MYNNNNKQTSWEIEKKHFGSTLKWMTCMMLDCANLAQSNVLRTIHHNVGLNCFFHLSIFLLLLLVLLTFNFTR